MGATQTPEAIDHQRRGFVALILASRGYRAIIPHVRGYGSTRFLSSETPRYG